MKQTRLLHVALSLLATLLAHLFTAVLTLWPLKSSAFWGGGTRVPRMANQPDLSKDEDLLLNSSHIAETRKLVGHLDPSLEPDIISEEIVLNVLRRRAAERDKKK
jgi:hypothetical protein